MGCMECLSLNERVEQTTRHYLDLIRLRQFAARECDIESRMTLEACIRNADAERKTAREELSRHSRYEHGAPHLDGANGDMNDNSSLPRDRCRI